MGFRKMPPPWVDWTMVTGVCAGFGWIIGGAWFALAIVVMMVLAGGGGWLLERRSERTHHADTVEARRHRTGRLRDR